MLLNDLLKDERFAYSAQSKIDAMESRGLLEFSGFTPTDALHVLRRLERWDTASAERGARILAGNADKAEQDHKANGNEGFHNDRLVIIGSAYCFRRRLYPVLAR